MRGATSACTLQAHPWRSTAVDRYRTSPLLPRRNVTWTHAPPCGTLPPSHKCEREIGQRMALEQDNALGVFFPPSRERTLCGKKSTRFSETTTMIQEQSKVNLRESNTFQLLELGFFEKSSVKVSSQKNGSMTHFHGKITIKQAVQMVSFSSLCHFQIKIQGTTQFLRF